MNIVLYEPEMPANTGNIGRTCVATGTRLHLIEPLGFRLGEKELKRAGMDYWKDLDVSVYVDYEEFLWKNPKARIYMATTRRQMYIQMSGLSRTVISCLGRRAQGYRRRSCGSIRRMPYAFR